MKQRSLRLAALVLGLGVLASAPTIAMAGGDTQWRFLDEACWVVTTDGQLDRCFRFEDHYCPVKGGPLTCDGTTGWSPYRLLSSKPVSFQTHILWEYDILIDLARQIAAAERGETTSIYPHPDDVLQLRHGELDY